MNINFVKWMSELLCRSGENAELCSSGIRWTSAYLGGTSPLFYINYINYINFIKFINFIWRWKLADNSILPRAKLKIFEEGIYHINFICYINFINFIWVSEVEPLSKRSCLYVLSKLFKQLQYYMDKKVRGTAFKTSWNSIILILGLLQKLEGGVVSQKGPKTSLNITCLPYCSNVKIGFGVIRDPRRINAIGQYPVFTAPWYRYWQKRIFWGGNFINFYKTVLTFCPGDPF